MVSQQFTRGLSQANPLLLIYPRGIHPSQEFMQFCVWFSTAFSRTPEISCDMQFTRVFGQKRWFPLLRRMKVVKLHRWTEFACVDALSTWVGPTGVSGPPGGSRAHGPFSARLGPPVARFGPFAARFLPFCPVFTVRLPSSDLVVSTHVLWPQVARLGRPVARLGPSGARFRSICPLLSVPLPSTDLPVSTTRFRDVVRRIRGGVCHSHGFPLWANSCFLVRTPRRTHVFPKITPLGSLT
jgi:hypothetical protein